MFNPTDLFKKLNEKAAEVVKNISAKTSLIESKDSRLRLKSEIRDLQRQLKTARKADEPQDVISELVNKLNELRSTRNNISEGYTSNNVYTDNDLVKWNQDMISNGRWKLRQANYGPHTKYEVIDHTGKVVHNNFGHGYDTEDDAMAWNDSANRLPGLAEDINDEITHLNQQTGGTGQIEYVGQSQGKTKYRVHKSHGKSETWELHKDANGYQSKLLGVNLQESLNISRQKIIKE